MSLLEQSGRVKFSAAHREAVDLRDLLSYRVALLARVNDRAGQAEIQHHFGITLGEWRVMGVVGYLGEATQRAVARQAFLDEGQVSRSVAALVERSLIRRQTSSMDRRESRLRLSAAGKRLHGRVITYARAANQPRVYGLTAPEQTELMRLLDKLLGRVHADYAALRPATRRR
jgi:DNA-binding MarR family transcriptional regulator